MSAEEGYKVTLHVYDLSQGLARQLSTTFLGTVIEAIWHTGVVIYGTEYYFGGGIQHAPVGTTQYGTPMKVIDLGITHIPKDVFEMYLQEISPRYTAETYSLLKHNCNNFSNEVAQFLVGVTIPDYILQLPNEVMNSPMGALIMPMIQQLETTMKSGAVPQVPQFTSPSMAQPFQSSAQIPQLPSRVPIPQSSVKSEEVPVKIKESEKSNLTVPPAVKPGGDSLGNARSKIQEEINNEFAALMASGTLRAGEAAALATRKVMQRYGHFNAAMQQS